MKRNQWEDKVEVDGRKFAADLAQAKGFVEREEWDVTSCGDAPCWVNPETGKVWQALDNYRPQHDSYFLLTSIEAHNMSVTRVRPKLDLPVEWCVSCPKPKIECTDQVLNHAILKVLIEMEKRRGR